MGEWFVVRYVIWPRSRVLPTYTVYRAGSEGIYTQDIQKTVQSWGNNGTGMYGFYCSPISHCDGNFDKDACEDHEVKVRPWLFFILWSIRNFNNWMVSLVTAVDHTAGVADGMAGKLVDTFSNNVEDVVSRLRCSRHFWIKLTLWPFSLLVQPVPFSRLVLWGVSAPSSRLLVRLQDSVGQFQLSRLES